MGILNALKRCMVDRGLKALLVPSNDMFFYEEVARYNEILEYITGFTGSYAVLIAIAEGKSQFFTDGRYLEQASLELDNSEYNIHDISKITPWSWMDGQKSLILAYDPSLHTVHQIEKFNCVLKPLEDNLIDLVWKDNPGIRNGMVDLYIRFAVSSMEKRRAVIDAVDGYPYLISDPESLCWLLNIRGKDLVYSPLVLALGVLYPDDLSCELFYDGEVNIVLDKTVIFPLSRFYSRLAEIPKLALDLKKTSVKALNCIAEYRSVKDPCALLKSSKNPDEIKACKRAHISDGVAMTKFLYWLYHNEFTEASAEAKILQLRSEQKGFWGPSFKTIAAYGAHASLVHYSKNIDDPINPGNVFLIDSGGQYLDGTTDVTRTIAVGEVRDAEIMRNYTLVLKGHIQISKVIFPKGTIGERLDSLARQFLWQHKIDYPHGTGHGVGMFLNVHEGPFSFSCRDSLPEGLIISNEPGFYKPGCYGIRIENLLYVKKAEDRFLCFEPLTCVPINTDLVDCDLLNKDEIDWLNSYNYWILQQLEPYLGSEILAWVKNWLI